ncbi:MAG: amino-acid N-acetyltransferase, partial [Rhodocyclaceae bacterium]|nr:amino-acid N-acetyltransferase [Rhodocyclaceae bacterium]
AAESLARALEDHHVVLIAPFGVSPSGEVFNLSMEEVAERVAVALAAVKLVYLCDAPGVLDEAGQLVSAMTADEAQRWLGEGRGITEDLGLYLPYAIRAVQNGVRRSHLIDRDLDGALLIEVFTPSGIGTVITEQALARVRDAGPEDVGSIVRLIAPLEADGTLVPRGRERLEMEIERFSVIEHDGVVVGCAALYPYIDEAVAELACVAVMPLYRQRGFGEIILAHMEQRARVAGLKKLLVLTTRTAHWFVERGFREVAVDALPASKRALYNMQRRSKVFVKEI